MDIATTKTLHDGVEIPLLGLGVYQSEPGQETEHAVRLALDVGYRHIDTAAFYGNEESVGQAVRDSGIPRKEIFVTTKLRNPDFDDPVGALQTSLRKLDIGYIDLYLLHFPVEGKRLAAWESLTGVAHEQYFRSLGVSNFTIRHLEELAEASDVAPTVNQVEFTPFLYQKDLLDYCISHDIALEAYSPLTRGKRFDDPTIVSLAEQYGKTPAQILLRWCLQHEIITIPKSVKEERIRENADLYDFHITTEDMMTLDKLDEGYRLAWDPTDVA